MPALGELGPEPPPFYGPQTLGSLPFGAGSPVEMSRQPSGLASLGSGIYEYLGNLAKRAIGNSQTALDTGTYNPAPVAEAAMLPMGTGAIVGVPVGARDVLMGAGSVRRLPSSASLAMPPAPTAENMLRSAKVESVPLSQVRSTQPKMEWQKFDSGEHPPPMLGQYADRPVAVRREDGEYLIFDGHHRTAKAMSDGAEKMEMYVINAKDYAPEFAGRKPAPDTTNVDDLLRHLLGK